MLERCGTFCSNLYYTHMIDMTDMAKFCHFSKIDLEIYRFFLFYRQTTTNTMGGYFLYFIILKSDGMVVGMEFWGGG